MDVGRIFSAFRGQEVNERWIGSLYNTDMIVVPRKGVTTLLGPEPVVHSLVDDANNSPEGRCESVAPFFADIVTGCEFIWGEVGGDGVDDLLREG